VTEVGHSRDTRRVSRSVRAALAVVADLASIVAWYRVVRLPPWAPTVARLACGFGIAFCYVRALRVLLGEPVDPVGARRRLWSLIAAWIPALGLVWGLPLRVVAPVIGALAGATSVTAWVAVWMNARRLRGESRPVALGRGIASVGRAWVHPVVHKLSSLSVTPAGGGSRMTGSPSPSLARAFLYGAGLVITICMLVSTATGAAVYEVGNRLRPNADSSATPAAHTASPVAQGGSPSAGAGPDGDEGRGAGSADAGPHGRGSLHCTSSPGVGPGIPDGAAKAAQASAATYRREGFHLCTEGAMTSGAIPGTYEQPVFTNDGDGARRLAWRLKGGWVGAFVPSDAAAAYRVVDADLDWRNLGLPLDFMKCRGRWVQPLLTLDGEVTAVGVRSRKDREGAADRPIFVWVGTFDLVRHLRPEQLPKPAASPTPLVGSELVRQWFVGLDQPIDSDKAGDEQLTLDQLASYCAT
jgi:hypothetical protein